MAGYGHDGAQAALGFEKQGRVAEATLTLHGRLHERFRYRLRRLPYRDWLKVMVRPDPPNSLYRLVPFLTDRGPRGDRT